MFSKHQDRILVVFGSVPKDGGTFTFYRNLRPALLQYGIDIRCVSVGKAQSQLREDAYADEGCVLLAASTHNVKKQAQAFAEWCEQKGVDIVMGINSEAILSSLPHLPEKIRVMSRCANAFDHGYRITMSCENRLAAIIATTPRLKNDLIDFYGANPSLLHLIPNGIDPVPFDKAAVRVRGQSDAVQLGFLGRLEDSQKGVFHIPKIVQELNRLNIKFKLRIAGKGKHRSIIEGQMKDEMMAGQVEFLGALTPDNVPGFLSDTDIFVFTSHFEGCPNALLEALMAGCVPVSWLIEGITNYIIEDGETGFVHATGDYEAFAKSVEMLDRDRGRLILMSKAASEDAHERFTNQRTGADYAELIEQVMATPPLQWDPLPWNEFQSDPNFHHSWRDWVPDSIKFWIKRLTQKS